METIIILIILMGCIILHYSLKEKDKSTYYTVKKITWLSRDAPFDFGYGNGYVGVNKNHPCYGKSYDDVPVDVHGGITYAELHGDYWVFGFDTCHYTDTLEKWPYEKVLEETIYLKNQLKELY